MSRLYRSVHIGKTDVSVLLRLFIYCYEIRHTIDAQYGLSDIQYLILTKNIKIRNSRWPD